MAKRNPIDVLVEDFKADDLGTFMDAYVEGKHIRVALWNEGLQQWVPTDEGLALVDPPARRSAAKPAAQPEE